MNKQRVPVRRILAVAAAALTLYVGLAQAQGTTPAMPAMPASIVFTATEPIRRLPFPKDSSTVLPE